MGAILEEHDERFHQDISQIVKRYNAKWSPNVLADMGETNWRKQEAEEDKVSD